MSTFATPTATVSRTPERTRVIDHGLDHEGGSHDESVTPSARRSAELGEAARHLRSQPAAGQSAEDTGREERPLHLAADGVAEEAEDAEEEADDEVRADDAHGGHPDAAQQRRHAQRAEDDADRAAEQADGAAEGGRREEPGTIARLRVERPREQVDAVPDQDGGDRREEEALGNRVTVEASDERADDRRRRHPGDDPPVDPPGPRVLDAAGGGRGGADGDVRTRRGGRVTRHDEHERQPQGAQHEPEHRPEVAGHERADKDEGYFPGFQSVSAWPAAALAARARMKSRSERRFR